MQSLSPDLVRFAETYVPSLEDLRVLVLFVEGRDRWFDASGIARALSMSRTTARSVLDHLARHNLLDIRVTGDVRYRFRPGTADLEAQATALVHTYRRNPLKVLHLLG
jgi:DNA-binding IclR family transcriptional regulator